jgi:hypothetical protein
LSPAYPAETLTAEKIGLMMGGVHHAHDGLRAAADGGKGGHAD